MNEYFEFCHAMKGQMIASDPIYTEFIIEALFLDPHHLRHVSLQCWTAERAPVPAAPDDSSMVWRLFSFFNEVYYHVAGGNRSTLLPCACSSVAFCRCGDRPWWMTMTSRVIGSSMPSVGEASGSTCSRRHQHSSAGHATPLLPRAPNVVWSCTCAPQTNRAPWNMGKSKRIAAASSREAGVQHRSWPPGAPGPGLIQRR